MDYTLIAFITQQLVVLLSLCIVFAAVVSSFRR